MTELNANGRLVCQMTATMWAGIMSNPAFNGSPLDATHMGEMAMEIMRLVVSVEEFCEKEET